MPIENVGVVGDERVITAILPRQTLLERAHGLDGPRRPIVANADLLMIVESLHSPPPRPTLIDRYLVAGHVGQLTPVIVLTKSDLADAAVRDPLVELDRLAAAQASKRRRCSERSVNSENALTISKPPM